MRDQIVDARPDQIPREMRVDLLEFNIERRALPNRRQRRPQSLVGISDPMYGLGGSGRRVRDDAGQTLDVGGGLGELGFVPAANERATSPPFQYGSRTRSCLPRRMTAAASSTVKKSGSRKASSMFSISGLGVVIA